MEGPEIAIHTPSKSKKRYFGGSTSSSNTTPFMDSDDVIEIPPPATWKSKPKPVICREVIVVDDDDSDDIMIIDEKVAPNSKGKKPMLKYYGINSKSENKRVHSPKANDFLKTNLSPHVPVINEAFSGMQYIDGFYDDECAMLASHFGGDDIPSGIEATWPSWQDSLGGQKNAVSGISSSVFGTLSYSDPYIDISGVNQFQSWSSEASQAKKPVSEVTSRKSKASSSGVRKPSDFHEQPNGMIAPKPHWPPASAHKHKNKNLPPSSHGNEPPVLGKHLFGLPHVSHAIGNISALLSGIPQFFGDPSISIDDSVTAHISPPSTDGQGDTSESSILKKLELFQRFDSVKDHSDHHFNSNKGSSTETKSWKKKIFAEWDMLKKDLPDTIYVRIYEERIDLLRAVIVGADGTPYHDGLFFFDVYFTSSYPSTPPSVHYHAHGLRINPNLYNCGKVCLSLLGTWSGRGNENWRPGKSNMLQVLVSIQALILNEEPYYNEPGYAKSKNDSHSKDYSENAFLLSLKTMLYTMKNPPKHFEDLVYGHFYKHAHDILSACTAYLEGVPVGGFVKGKSLAAQKTSKTCSHKLKTSLPGYIKTLVDAFSKIGVKDCQKYLVPVDKGASQSARGIQRGKVGKLEQRERCFSLAYARMWGGTALIAHFQNSTLMNEDKRCQPVLSRLQMSIRDQMVCFKLAALCDHGYLLILLLSRDDLSFLIST